MRSLRSFLHPPARPAQRASTEPTARLPSAPSAGQSSRSSGRPVCDTCGDPLPSWRVLRPSPGCGRCRAAAGTSGARGQSGAYEGALRSIVHALKYDARRSLAPRLAHAARPTGARLLEGADIVVPVPLHRARLRTRGFNQAEDIARGSPIPMMPRVEADAPDTVADRPAGGRALRERAWTRSRCDAESACAARSW